MRTASIHLPTLFEWLGPDGVRAGLKASKVLKISALREMAAENGVAVSPKASRTEIINLLVLMFDKHIDKTIDQMKAMSSGDLVAYLNATRCSKEEVQALLIELEIPFKRADSRQALIRHAADQITNLGIYQRIAGEDSPN